MNAPLLAFKGTVVSINEHHRTIRGRIDPASGRSVTEHINLGYFIHVEVEGVHFLCSF